MPHKKDNDIFSCNSSMHRWILIILARIFRRKAIEICYNFSSHLISVSALPCKTGNMEITTFHLNVALVTNTQNTPKLSQNHRQTILHSYNDRQYAPNMTKTEHKSSNIWISDMYTVGVYHVCHGMSVMGVFRLILKINGHYQWDI